MTDVGPDPHYVPPALPAEEAEALAERYEMREVNILPGLGAYLRDLWRHRHLMWSLAKGEFISQHQDNYLGVVWSVLNPILLGVAYYLIFGLLIGTRAGIDNFVSFLTIGLFVFIPVSTALNSGSKSLISKLKMIRAMTFPRVILPLTVTLATFVSALPAFAVLLIIALVSGERPNVTWLLYPVALGIVVMMCSGIAMIGARLVHAVRDAANLMPLITRLLRYTSGVFFSVEASIARFDGAPAWVGHALEYQPVAIALTLVREPLMAEYAVRWETWAVATGWAVGFFLFGLVYFWRGENTYGRA